jgi:hypothetical protein
VTTGLWKVVAVYSSRAGIFVEELDDNLHKVTAEGLAHGYRSQELPHHNHSADYCVIPNHMTYDEYVEQIVDQYRDPEENS